MQYPDAAGHVAAWLQFTLNPTAAEGLPLAAKRAESNLAYSLPYIVVTRIGGPSRLTLDLPVLDVDCYSNDDAAASDLAEQVRELMETRLPKSLHDGVFATGVTTVQGPVERLSGIDGFRYQATYRVGLRSAA